MATLLFRWVFVSDIGLANAVLRWIGIGDFSFLNNPTSAMALLIAVSVWKRIGYALIILLAGLKSIPDDYREAAELDGASNWQVFRLITLPLLKTPLLLVAIVLTLSNINTVETPLVLTGGGPGSATRILPIEIYDLDFDNGLHGQDGPIPIFRIPRSQWPEVSLAGERALAELGFHDIEDQNGVFTDGYFPMSLPNNRGRHRVSTAMAYLDTTVRSRSNLTIMPDTEVTRLIVDDGRVGGVSVVHKGQTEELRSREVIVASGAIHSPALLMKSGIGPAFDMKRQGIDPILDLPGVGRNLQEHPGIDPETGKVHGIKGLRVADASVMPSAPRANLDIPVIMIAEKMADNVRCTS